MEPGHALICGAGIAGPATAYWLSRHGWDTTLIERADRFPSGGQNIDIRSAAREVIRRMQLEDAALQHGTGEKGIRFVDARGHVDAQFAHRLPAARRRRTRPASRYPSTMSTLVIAPETAGRRPPDALRVSAERRSPWRVSLGLFSS